MKKNPYVSLEQLQQRKEQLREIIALEDKEIHRLWTQLAGKDKNSSRGDQLAAYVSYGVMAYDTFMMLRKLKKGYGSILNIFRRRN